MVSGRTVCRYLILCVAMVFPCRLVNAQISNPPIIFVATAPSGSCTDGSALRVVVSTGDLYSCQAGTWGEVGGGGGGAAVATEFILSGAGSQNFAHNLNSEYPFAWCYTKSGAQWGPASLTPVDANNITFTSAGATDTVCNFSVGGALPPNFLLSVSPTSQTYTISGSGTQTTPPYTVTQSALNGYSGTTTPTCTGLASGMSCSFSPSTMTGAATSSLTLSFPASQAAATTNFTISATDGTLTNTTPAAITVVASNTLDAWLMNEGSGTTFLDTNTSNANNQTFSSGIGSWGTVAGFPGSVFTFNGTGGSTGSNNTLTNFDGTTPFSISLWVKPATLPAQADLVSTYGASAPYTGYDVAIQGSPADNVVTFFLINTYSSNAIVVNTPSNSITTGTLYNIIVTYDGSQTAAGTKIYLNGVSQTLAIQQNTLTASTATSNKVMLGSSLQAQPLDGTMADTRIYNVPLTSGQVSTLYAAGPQ